MNGTESNYKGNVGMKETVSAYVFINTELDKGNEVAEKVRGIGCSETYVLNGTFDIAAKVSASSLKDLNTKIQDIRSLKDVKKSLSLLLS